MLSPDHRLTAITEAMVASITQRYDSLDTLNLSNHSIARIEKLAPLSSLTSLDLSHNRISALSNLHDLPHLTELNLSSNALTSLEGIAPCGVLQCLDVANNGIRDATALQPLQALPGLHTLTLRGNPLAAEQAYQQQVHPRDNALLWCTRVGCACR